MDSAKRSWDVSFLWAARDPLLAALRGPVHLLSPHPSANSKGTCGALEDEQVKYGGAGVRQAVVRYW